MKSRKRKIFSILTPERKGGFSISGGEDKKLITKIQSKGLTYLSKNRLASIVTTCRQIEDQKLPGIMLEAGCALGGSAILIASTKNAERPLYIYDVFGMIPSPTSEDGKDVQERYETIIIGKSKGIQGEKYYGYEENLFEIVLRNLENFGVKNGHDVTLVKGLLQETMKIHQPVSFAHIDVDWYDPVKVCLERVIPKLVVGGSVILDDYHDWSGCYKATTEYFQGHSHKFNMDDSAGSLKITRIKN